MSIEITTVTDNANQQSSKTPNIVLEIDGYPTLFGAVVISKKAEYGDPIKYGDPGLVYGGRIPIDDQEDLITLSGGTTTTLTQNVDVDKGRGNSIQSFQVALVDKNDDITKLITPGQELSELLGRKCKLYFGFANTSFPEDYIVFFRGNIDEINSGSAGNIILNIIHPDKKKKATLFTKTQAVLADDMDIFQTFINVDDASTFFSPVAGPSGAIDDNIKYYVRIDDEVMRYEGISGNQFTSVSRAQLGSVAAEHTADADVESIIVISGNVISDITLKLLLSGRTEAWVSNYPVSKIETRVNAASVTQTVLIFNEVNLIRDFNVRIGDFLTLTGSAIPANTVSLEPITDVQVVDDNTEIFFDTVLTPESPTTGVIELTSQYNVWGEDRGMGLAPDEVDIDQHDFIRNTFLPTFDYEIYIKDTIDDAKEFLEQSIYLPAGCFSLVRKAQASIGIHAPPLPDADIPVLSAENVKNPKKLRLKRSLSKNFYNGVVYRLDDDIFEDRFFTTVGFVDGDSRTRFGNEVPSSPLIIEAKGLRSDNLGVQAAQSASERRLKTYRFGAEFIDKLEVNLQGLVIEAGDVVLLDMESLNMSDIQSGTRSGEPRLFRCEKKTWNLKTGEIFLSLTDTSFDKDSRFGLVSPASLVRSGASEREFTIKPSFNTETFGDNEFRKWIDFIGSTVTVRDQQFTEVGTADIESITGNVIRLSADLGFIPQENYVMVFADYNQLTAGAATDSVKLLYAFKSDGTNDFDDGKPPYLVF